MKNIVDKKLEKNRTIRHKCFAYFIYIALIPFLLLNGQAEVAPATTFTVPHGSYLDSSTLCENCHLVHEGQASFSKESSSLAFENDHVAVSTVGSWSTTIGPDFSNGSALESTQTGAALSFEYTEAKEAKLMGVRGPDKGIAKIYSNGLYMGSADLYAAQPTSSTPFYRIGGTSETRTITIKVSGLKNPASSGIAVIVDAFLVEAPKIALLTTGDDKAVCYTCHNGTGGTTDVMSEFGETTSTTAPVSRHPVPERSITCSSCHSPHKEIENWDLDHRPNEVISLLRGVFRFFLGYVVSVDNISWLDRPQNDLMQIPAQRRIPQPLDFCGACHSQTGSLDDKVTYIRGTGHDSTTSISPDAQSGISCLTCHEWHVSAILPKLLLNNINGTTITASDNSVCYACHPVDLADPSQYFVQLSPSGDIHGVADSTETTSAPGLKPPYSYRMKELLCRKCHDPHGSENLFWIPKNIDQQVIEVKDASDSAGILDFCSTCHETSYIHGGTPPDDCFSCHFHGANSVDADTQTVF